MILPSRTLLVFLALQSIGLFAEQCLASLSLIKTLQGGNLHPIVRVKTAGRNERREAADDPDIKSITSA